MEPCASCSHTASFPLLAGLPEATSSMQNTAESRITERIANVRTIDAAGARTVVGRALLLVECLVIYFSCIHLAYVPLFLVLVACQIIM